MAAFGAAVAVSLVRTDGVRSDRVASLVCVVLAGHCHGRTAADWIGRGGARAAAASRADRRHGGARDPGCAECICHFPAAGTVGNGLARGPGVPSPAMGCRTLPAAVRSGRSFYRHARRRLVDNLQPWHFGDASVPLADRILAAQTLVLAGALLALVLAALFAERRRNETTLKIGSQRLELALGGAKLGVFSLDLDTGRIECDARTAHISRPCIAARDHQRRAALRSCR